MSIGPFRKLPHLSQAIFVDLESVDFSTSSLQRPTTNCPSIPIAAVSTAEDTARPSCWQGPACARRARSEMHPSPSPRYDLITISGFPRHSFITRHGRPTGRHQSIGAWAGEKRSWSREDADLFHQQRAASSSSGAAEAAPASLNIAAIASTAVAAGSMAWYYHLYGPTAHAMTAAEEG